MKRQDAEYWETRIKEQEKWPILTSVDTLV
jgi:hypothetical protein